ncbi:hypothetical protein [Pseudorhodobacter sp.]|uniref:hypothetical protein n=1 Tax=Pseudorhodobacter sp. TaxID=1934400 RepID=UPI002648F0C6|nr:hypothetical protein [Pseudorhodobacter sp.]MDN5789072.1 hypothetical protein [Pseudorhodobacter sp.]
MKHFRKDTELIESTEAPIKMKRSAAAMPFAAAPYFTSIPLGPPAFGTALPTDDEVEAMFDNMPV